MHERTSSMHSEELGMTFKQNGALMDRRSFLTRSSLALAAVAGCSVFGTSCYAWSQGEAGETVEVKTAYGRLRGKRNGDVITFKGVPYAGSVSGGNRFK